MSEGSDDELVRELRRALNVEASAARPSGSSAPAASAPSTDDPPVTAARRAPVGAAALGIADDLLGIVPSFATPVRGVELALCRNGAIHSVPRQGVVLGRRAAPGVLVIDDRHVSREHARIVPIDGSLQIVDIGSSNGTAIRRNGVRIEVGPSAVVLEAGDHVVTVNDVELIEIVESHGP